VLIFCGLMVVSLHRQCPHLLWADDRFSSSSVPHLLWCYLIEIDHYKRIVDR
ncbi:hypothetical protein AVEN_223537-1, partial [Araneus ventricosus]